MITYVERFERLGFGLFVHFGLYSVYGKGEWAKDVYKIPDAQYGKLTGKFKVAKNWAKELVRTAKAAGAKYITLTTRHHDGFSLYDTCGLNDYDAPHSAAGRDLVREFVDACNAGGIVPFFYHTLLDWHHPDYERDFPKYIDYLVRSIEILCTRYGRIGGLWFDGMWNKPDADWQEDRIYGTIRKYQPEAMIINNTGLSELGKVGHPELDSVTFERGKPCFVDNSDRHRAGEMCQVLNDHWGYAKNDCNYKSVGSLIRDLVDCRRYGCNFLLNTGPRGNGMLNPMDKALLCEIGKWVHANKGFIYGARPCGIEAENAVLMQGDGCIYAVAEAPRASDPDVAGGGVIKEVKIGADIAGSRWLDTGKKINVQDNGFTVEPFSYGTSRVLRVAEIKLK